MIYRDSVKVDGTIDDCVLVFLEAGSFDCLYPTVDTHDRLGEHEFLDCHYFVLSMCV